MQNLNQVDNQNKLRNSKIDSSNVKILEESKGNARRRQFKPNKKFDQKFKLDQNHQPWPVRKRAKLKRNLTKASFGDELN